MVLPRLGGFGSIQAHSKSKTVSSKAQIPIVNLFKTQSHVWFMSWMTKHANPPCANCRRLKGELTLEFGGI